MKAIIRIELDALGNMEVFSNLAEKPQQLEVLRMALHFVKKEPVRGLWVNGTQKPDKSRPFSGN